MGALTLKNFPFELRGWEVQKFKTFDPSDGFISSTTVYINKNKIVQIEPAYNSKKSSWLSDKGRHFFDSIYKPFFENSSQTFNSKLYNKILTKIYIFEHCRKQNNKLYLFTIIFDFLSIELLGIINIISKHYSFIKLRQVHSSNKLIDDFESSFQINNNFCNKTSLINSSLCLLITTNPRYEGYYLNLNLRQRVLKKKFKCIMLGSLINLTFPMSFLGSNISIVKTIAEGNHFICQNFRHSENPLVICNLELFKRTDHKTITKIVKTLFYLNLFNKMWFGFNILSSSVSEVASITINSTKKINLIDLYNSSSIYFLNVSVNKIAYLKRLIELQLLQQKNNFGISKNSIEKKIILDHSYKVNNNLKISNKMLADYIHIPTLNFFQNEETFINTEGFIKKTTKITSKKKIKNKNNWKILRKLLKFLKNKQTYFNIKDNELLHFNLNKFYNFKNFISFQYYPVKKITNLSFYLNIKNNTFIINNFFFKKKSKKFINTKITYWLDDFFNCNKDNHSQYSTVLANCSRHIKNKKTNFF